MTNKYQRYWVWFVSTQLICPAKQKVRGVWFGKTVSDKLVGFGKTAIDECGLVLQNVEWQADLFLQGIQLVKQ